MRPTMKATELEKLVIGSMFLDPELQPIRSAATFEAVTVSDRQLTGAGFLTEFEPSEELRLFDASLSLRWGKVGARLNASKVETGYLVYVDGGCLNILEGYSYWGKWASQRGAIRI